MREIKMLFHRRGAEIAQRLAKKNQVHARGQAHTPEHWRKTVNPLRNSARPLRLCGEMFFQIALLLAFTTIIVAQPPVPTGKPAAAIDLATNEGVALVKGEWRYSDTRITEVDFKGPGADNQPTGKPIRQAAQHNLLLPLLAFLGFISIDLDGLLGVAWPSMRTFFHLPIDALGGLLVSYTAAYLLSSFSSGRVLTHFSVGFLLALRLA